MALGLVAQGAHVLGTAVRAGDELAQTAAAAAAAARDGGVFEPCIADVRDDGDCARSVARAVALFGRLDVLINNAARGPLEANPDYFQSKPRFWQAPPEAYRTMVETNLIGAFQMARAAVPGMLGQGFGRIVNISTSLPTMVMQGLAAYGSTKAALEVATVVWAKDLEGSGVTANILLPGGPSDTALIPGGVVGTRAKADFRAGKGPVGDEGRVGGILPAEIMVPPTLWLCADESARYNGRRFVAKDWDDELPPAEAASRAVQPQHATPRIM
jgi:3-oxoacyl-[acyl-carrier protein] reductase